MSQQPTPRAVNDVTAPDGPFVAELKICLTDGEGTFATATYACGLGEVPTDELVVKAHLEALAICKENLPTFRLATREEFVQQAIGEVLGYDASFAVPGPPAFRLVFADTRPAVDPLDSVADLN